jgi:hypothetical protein
MRRGFGEGFMEYAVVLEYTAMLPLVVSLLVGNAVAEWHTAKKIKKTPR